MKKKSVITEFFNTSNTADFLPKNGFNVDNLILAVADVFSGTYDRRHAPKKPRKTLEEINRQLDKVEKKLDSVLNRFIRFTDDLYIKTEGENFAHVDTHGEFVNLWTLCKCDKSEFETVTNWIKPDEIFNDWHGDFEEYPEAFRRLHFLENRREELLDQREELLKEYWDAQEQKKSA